MDEFVIRTNALTKRYSSENALDGITVNIPRGQIIGLLGPNGSGKTTFIKLIAGLLTPTSGAILINGSMPGVKTKAVVSYLPERPYFDMSMTGLELLDFFADFYSDFDRACALRMLSDLQIDPKSKLKTLSKGTKEKVQLILVMSRKAEVYLLDEPIAGVDPSAREYILNTIVSEYNKDATVIISTHLIADVEKTIDRALIIHRGRIIKDADVESIRSESGKSLDEYFREVFRC